MRILITILFIAIYRFGSFVVLPGIDPNRLQALHEQTSGGLMSLLNMFSGGAFSNASIFALGIMPYITASIIMQLLAVAVPQFQKMQREGESGRRKINQYTRYLTIAILLFQGPTYLLNLNNQAGSALAPGLSWTWFSISATIILAAGSMFVLWLGERITDKGIGNGVSLIIMVGIIARLPHALIAEFNTRFTEATGGFVMLVVELALLFLDRSGAGYAQDSRAVRQADRRQQAVRRSPSVYSAQDQCRRGHADHLRSGADVYPDVLQPFRGDERYRHRVLGLPRLLV